ncbi:MAG: hypothetical protein R3D52_09475 [Xanthobacteraceae bacterium]
MHVEIITAKEALVELRKNWDDVYRADPDSNFYMSWTWISGWFNKLGIQWIILAAKTDIDSSDYIGFLPLQLRSEASREGQFHNELRTGGGYFSGYTGLICRPEFESDVVRAFSERIKQLNWRRLHLENIHGSPQRIGAFLHEFNTNEFTVEKVIRPDDGDNVDHDIYVYVELPSDWDKFLYSIGTKPRRNARHALRPLESGGEYKITLPTAETIEQDVEALLKFWEIQWAEKLASRYNQRLPHAMMSNFRHMLMCCFAEDALFLPVLWKDNRAPRFIRFQERG